MVTAPEGLIEPLAPAVAVMATTTLILRPPCALSTSAQADPVDGVFEVNVEAAWPEVMVPEVGSIVPLVAPKLTATCGMKVDTDGTALAELCVMSAVTVDEPPGPIEAGEALTPN